MWHLHVTLPCTQLFCGFRTPHSDLAAYTSQGTSIVLVYRVANPSGDLSHWGGRAIGWYRKGVFISHFSRPLAEKLQMGRNGCSANGVRCPCFWGAPSAGFAMVFVDVISKNRVSLQRDSLFDP